MRKLLISLLLICSGVAGGWLLRGLQIPGDEQPVARGQPPRTVSGDEQPVARGQTPRTVWGQTPRAVSAKPPAPSEASFVEAVPEETYRRESARSVPPASVEEVKGVDGLTVDERTARWRREHPDEWQALQRRQSARLIEQQQVAQRRREFLAAISTDFLSSEQQTAHRSYLETLRTRDKLREKIAAARRSGQPVSADDARALMHALHAVREGAAAERHLLLEAAARSAGFKDAAATEFAGMLQNILDVTEPERR